MDAFLIFLTVFVTLVSSLCTALLIPLRQRRILAKGMPMLVLNIVGYAITVLIWAIVPTLYYRVGIDTDVLFVIPLGIAVLFVVAVIVTEVICGSLGRKVKKEKAQPKEQIVEEPAQQEQVVEEQVAEELVDEVQEEPVEIQTEEAHTEEQQPETEIVEQQPVEEQVAEVQEEPVEEIQPIEEQVEETTEKE